MIIPVCWACQAVLWKGVIYPISRREHQGSGWHMTCPGQQSKQKGAEMLLHHDRASAC